MREPHPELTTVRNELVDIQKVEAIVSPTLTDKDASKEENEPFNMSDDESTFNNAGCDDDIFKPS